MVSKKCIFFVMLCSVLSFSFSASSQNSRDTLIDAELSSPMLNDKSLTDGRAMVYALEGKAVFIPHGNPVERPLKVGDEIRAGDSVYTEKGTTLSIGFDKHRNNAVRIPADSKATFTNIEPTEIKLENGSIFSVVNGLAKGSTWKIATPSAVAAVRGTVYLVRYEAANGQFYAATVDVPNDGKASAIEIQSLTGDDHAEVGEGKEINLRQGEAPSDQVVKDLNPEQVLAVQTFFEQVSAESKELEKADGGEDSSSSDSSGEGNSGENSSEEGQGDLSEMGESPLDSIDEAKVDTGAELDQSDTNDEAFDEEKEEEPDYKVCDSLGNCD